MRNAQVQVMAAASKHMLLWATLPSQQIRTAQAIEFVPSIVGWANSSNEAGLCRIWVECYASV